NGTGMKPVHFRFRQRAVPDSHVPHGSQEVALEVSRPNPQRCGAMSGCDPSSRRVIVARSGAGSRVAIAVLELSIFVDGGPFPVGGANHVNPFAGLERFQEVAPNSFPAIMIE